MEPVEVTARFTQGGKIIPVQFTWQRRTYRVESTGRRWEDQAGLHILVMAAGEKVFDLVYSAGDGRWHLRQIGPGRAVA